MAGVTLAILAERPDIEASVFGLKRGMSLVEIKALNLGEVDPAKRMKNPRDGRPVCDGVTFFHHRYFLDMEASESRLLDNCPDRFIIRNTRVDGVHLIFLSVPPGIGLLQFNVLQIKEAPTREAFDDACEEFWGRMKDLQWEYGAGKFWPQAQVFLYKEHVIPGVLDPNSEWPSTEDRHPWFIKHLWSKWPEWLEKREYLLHWCSFHSDEHRFPRPDAPRIFRAELRMNGYGPHQVVFQTAYIFEGYREYLEIKRPKG